MNLFPLLFSYLAPCVSGCQGIYPPPTTNLQPFESENLLMPYHRDSITVLCTPYPVPRTSHYSVNSPALSPSHTTYIHTYYSVLIIIIHLIRSCPAFLESSPQRKARVIPSLLLSLPLIIQQPRTFSSSHLGSDLHQTGQTSPTIQTSPSRRVRSSLPPPPRIDPGTYLPTW